MKKRKMFKKEASITYLFIMAIIGIAFLLLYLIGNKFTGFVIFGQGNQTDFDEGTYNNTEWNSSAIVLVGNNLTGSYTSKIFDAGSDSSWNNISWTATSFGELPDNQQGSLMSGNVLLMHLNEASGTIEDTSGQGNNGTYNGALYSQSGKLNTAIGFDGIDDTISVQDDESIEMDDITVSVWFNVDSAPNGREMFKRWGSAGSYVFQHYFLSNKHTFRLTDDGVNVDCSPQYSSSVTLNVWSHLVFSFDNTNDEVVIMVNGKNESFNCAMSGLYSGSSQIINIGGSGIEFDGEIDEFAIWNKSLNVDEMLNLYKRGILRLNLTVRSCDDDACSGESYNDIIDTSPQDLSLTDNQYFQYNFDFATDNLSYTPQLLNVSIDYTVLNSAPTITLIKPQNMLYLNNESLSLNFSVSDPDANLDSCWYNIDNGQNITITNCQNTTFNVAEGSHSLMIYANDTQGAISNDDVSFIVDPNGVSVSILEPTGTKTSRTEISFSFSVVGSNVSCIYNVYRGTSVEVANTSVDCSLGSATGSFDVTVDADFTFNVYVNNTLGSSDSDSSSFSVDTSSSTPPPSGDGSFGGGSSSGGSGGGMVASRLKIEPISDLIADSGDSKKLRLRVENSQVKFIEGCRVIGQGNYSDWFSSTGIKGLAGGESYEFLIDLNIPEKLEAGIYDLSLKVVCEGLSEQVFFNLEIIEKKLEFDLIKVERIKKDQVKIIYSLEELSGLEQDVELQFLLFGYDNQKISEVRETKNLPSNTKEQFEVLIPIDPSLEGELSLLINLNSEVYSTFVEESITLGAFRTGFAIFGGANRGDNFRSGLLIFLFLVFAFFIIRKILKLGKIKKKKKK